MLKIFMQKLSYCVISLTSVQIDIRRIYDIVWVFRWIDLGQGAISVRYVVLKGFTEKQIFVNTCSGTVINGELS